MVIASAAVAGSTLDQLFTVLLEIFFLAQFLALFPIIAHSLTQHALVVCAHYSRFGIAVNHYLANLA